MRLDAIIVAMLLSLSLAACTSAKKKDRPITQPEPRAERAAPSLEGLTVDKSLLRQPARHEHVSHPHKRARDLPDRYDDGLLAFSRGHYFDAFQIFMSLAQKGYPEAQVMVGYLYMRGDGVEANDELAVDWFRKAASQGNADGQTNLGFMYAEGRGVPRDRDEAAKWYLYAAAQGHPGAQQNLASLFDDPQPFSLSLPQSQFDTVRDRARKGEADAMYQLGERYLIGVGVHPDAQTGLKWIRKAADAGSAAAQFRLGKLLVAGSYKLPKDEEQGRRLIEQAAEHGLVGAREWLVLDQGLETQPSDTVSDVPEEAQ